MPFKGHLGKKVLGHKVPLCEQVNNITCHFIEFTNYNSFFFFLILHVLSSLFIQAYGCLAEFLIPPQCAAASHESQRCV